MKNDQNTQRARVETESGSFLPTDWNSFLDLHQWLVARLAAGGCHKHDGEDAAQEALLKWGLREGEPLDPLHVRGWLLVVARNIARDKRRRSFCAVGEGIREDGAAEWGYSASVVEENNKAQGTESARDLLQPLFEAFDELRDRDRVVLCAWTLTGGDSTLIAEALQSRQEEVKVRVFRARRRLHRQILVWKRDRWGSLPSGAAGALDLRPFLGLARGPRGNTVL